MSINLNKNKEALLSAWKDVVDQKTKTNWALFSYEGQSNDLKLVSKGCGGIEEMTEDLNSGKIMYAFLQVEDPKTSLPKNVLINWQGEGAPNVRKGTCANHFREVSNFFKGAHVTINARTEEEVDSQIIIDKVSKSTGSVYSFKERVDHSSETVPVGTSYKRVIPKQEINPLERDKFWEKEEQEEKARQEFERKRKEEERRKLEEERERREVQETFVREAKIKERTDSIKQIRASEKVSADARARDVSSHEDIEKEERARRDRAEVLRRQRNQEAKQLISTRTIDARAVFEQNTYAGQLYKRRSSYQTNGSKTNDECVAELQHVEQNNVVGVGERKGSLPAWIPGYTEDKTETNHHEVKTVNVTNNPTQSVTAKEQKIITEEEEDEEQDWDDEVEHNRPGTIVTTLPEPEIKSTNHVSQELTDANDDSELLNGDDYGLTARALYDYQAADSSEITFDPGDIITHIDQIDEGWWQGLGPDGVFGLFPANYVELIN